MPRPEEAAGSLWQTAVPGSLEQQLGSSTVLGNKRDSNFMLEQGNGALARLTSRNAPARLVPGVDLLEDFSTMMRGLKSARTVQVFMRRNY